MSEKNEKKTKQEEYTLAPKIKAALQEMSKDFNFKAYPTKGKVSERSTIAARLGKHAILLLMPARDHVVVKIPVSGKNAKRIPVDSVTKFNDLKGKIRDLMKEATEKASKAAKRPKPPKHPKKAKSRKHPQKRQRPLSSQNQQFQP